MKKQSILLVDDEPEILETTKWAFEMNGYQVFTAANGAEALQWVQNSHPNVLLIDYKLPKMTGIELLQAVRASDHRVPAIIITGLTQDVDRVEAECQAAGAFAFLRKPLRMEEVLQTVKEALAHRAKRPTKPR